MPRPGCDGGSGILARMPTPPATSSAPAPAATVEAPAPTLKVFIQTKMTLAVATNAQGQQVLNVSLKEYDGFPVGGVPVAFSRPTMFGAVDLGNAKTDAAGNASFVVDGLPSEARQVAATFKGEKDWDASEAKIDVQLPVLASGQDVNTRNVKLGIDEPLLDPEGSLITPNPPLLPTTLFLVVVGVVWSIYLFVISQIYGILKLGRQRPQLQKERRFWV